MVRILAYDDEAFFALLAIVAIAAFALRIFPRILMPKPSGTDIFYHLYMSRRIRANQGGVPLLDKRLLYSPATSYPFLFHILMARVPPRFEMIYEKLVSPVCDATQVVFVGWLGAHVASYLTEESHSSNMIGLISATLVAIAPAHLAFAAGPRAYSGTPRTLGQLLFALSSGMALLFSVTSEIVWLLAAAAFAIPIVVTSKFGNQMLLLTAIGFGVAGYLWVPAMILAAVLLALATWRRLAINVLLGQFRHSLHYARNMQQTFLYPYERRLKIYLRSMAGAGFRFFTKPATSIRSVLDERYWIHQDLVLFPGLAIILLACFGGHPETGFRFGEPSQFLLVALLLAFLASALTARPPFMFLGEHYRYLEHFTHFIAIIVAVLVVKTENWFGLFLVLIYSLMFYAYSVGKLIDASRGAQSGIDDLVAILAPIDAENTRLYVLGAYFWPVLFASRKLRLHAYNANIDLSRRGNDVWQDLFGNFPNPGRALYKFAAQRGINYVIGKSGDVLIYKKSVGDERFDGFSLVSRVGEFELYRFKKEITKTP